MKLSNLVQSYFYVWIWAYISMHVCTYVRTYAYMHASSYVCVSMYVYIYVHNVLKDVVYRRKVGDLADLRQRIIEAVELITSHMLINT